MTREQVPARWVWKCDGCGFDADGGFNNIPPAHWGQLTLAQDAYDYQGAAVADGTIKRDLCSDCTAKVGMAIENALSPETNQ